MRHADVVVVGGGFAGSFAAAMLSRSGIESLLIDPHRVYPPDFRCEKLDSAQLQTLALTGLADPILNVSTPYRETWAARFGRIVEVRPEAAHGILYDTLVNTARDCISPPCETIRDKVVGISTGSVLQKITLSNGEVISTRLAVLATGLNMGLRHKLNMAHEVISANHSVSIGFDIQPVGRDRFPFPSLTYFAERPSDRMAYLTVFPIGGSIRVNLFGYRDLHDAWLKQLRDGPKEVLYAMWPGLRGILGDFSVSGRVHIRPVDLYVTRGSPRDGVVLVGDAFSTSCPAAGTGVRKALVDVERLCNTHIPRWLATPGMSAKKTEAFYEDDVKRRCDEFSIRKAFELRSFSIDPGVRWTAMRWAKFLGQRGRATARRFLKPRSLFNELPTLRNGADIACRIVVTRLRTSLGLRDSASAGK